MKTDATIETYTAFVGVTRVEAGSLEEILRAIKARTDREATPDTPSLDGLLIFADSTGKQVDFDFSGSVEQVLRRALPKARQNGPGRPKLGVVSREVTLLPRQWEWLEAQPNGVSAALRRLIDEARKRESESGAAGARKTVDAVGRIMTAMAGDLSGFEEAYRALYARDGDRFERQIRNWPGDIRAYLLERVRPALQAFASQ